MTLQITTDMSEGKRACLKEGPKAICPGCRTGVPLRDHVGAVGYAVFFCPNGCEPFGPGVERRKTP